MEKQDLFIPNGGIEILTGTIDPQGSVDAHIGREYYNTSNNTLWKKVTDFGDLNGWTLINSIVSVKDFGAVGDGTSDDTLAIQQAWDSAILNNENLYFPSGEYRITDTITGKPLLFIGHSNSSIVFDGFSGKDGIVWQEADQVGVTGGMKRLTLIAKNANGQTCVQQPKNSNQYSTYQTRWVYEDIYCRGYNRNLSGYSFCWDYGFAKWFRGSDANLTSFKNVVVQGQYDIKLDPASQFQDCGIELDANGAILSARMENVNIGPIHTGINIGDKVFFSLENFDIIGTHRGVYQTGTTIFNEPKIKFGNINAQETGIYINGSDTRDITSVTVRRHSSGWKSATWDWNGIKLENCSNVTLSCNTIQPDESAGAFSGNMTAYNLIGCSLGSLSDNFVGVGNDKGIILDNCTGFTVNNTITAQNSGTDVLFDLKNNTRVTSLGIYSQVSSFAGTVLAKDGTVTGAISMFNDRGFDIQSTSNIVMDATRVNAGTDSKKWRDVISTTGKNRQVVNDAGSATNYEIVTRSGATVSSIEWRASKFKLNNGPEFFTGSGSPEGSVTAPLCSLYLRTNGTTSNTLYVKERGTGNTGWVAMNSACVNVKNFGAVGNGSTDDTAAFTLAEAVSDSIYVPSGTYIVTGTLTKRYFGDGIISISGISYKVSNPGQYINTKFNTTLGVSASVEGTYNTTLGYNTGGNFGSGANSNVLVGHNLGSGDTIYPEQNQPFTGYNNVGVGFHALKKNQTGHDNVAIGRDSLNENYTGAHNVTIGTAAGQQITDMSDNVAIGSASSGRLDDGNGLNTTVGRDSGRENKDGERNSILGWGAGRGVTPTPATHTGDGTTTTFSAGSISLTGTKQIRVDVNGVNILPSQYTVSGTNVIFNTAPANGAAIVLTYTIGSASYNHCTFIGHKAGYTIKTGSNNTTVGSSAGENLSVGANNTYLGYQAGQSNDGSGNVFIGNLSSRAVTGISNRLAIANNASTPLITGFFDTNVVRTNASLQPEGDNGYALGSASRRWSVVYSATGAINTSDKRFKTNIRKISEAEKKVAKKLKGMLCAFQMKDAVKEKGEENARVHFGIIAQDVIKAFEKEGLNPNRYALFCYDKWEAEYEPITKEIEVEYTTEEDIYEPILKEVQIDEDGKMVTKFVDTGERKFVKKDVQIHKGTKFVDTGEKRLVKPAGERYGIRYEQLLAFIISAL